MSQIVDVQWPSDEDKDNEKHEDDNQVTSDESHVQDSSGDNSGNESNNNADEVNSSDNKDEEQNMSAGDSENQGEQKSESTSSGSSVVGESTKNDVKKQGKFSFPKNSSKLPKSNRMSTYVIEAVLVLVVVGLGLWCWNLYNDRKNLQSEVSSLNQNPQSQAQKQTQIVVNQVSKLMQLPSNETPTIVEVSNAAQAKKQSAFFQNAQNGDKALLYIKAGEAVLYRPSTNKIVAVAPITYNSASASTTTSNSSK